MSPEGHHTETSISTVCTQNNIDSNIWSIPWPSLGSKGSITAET